MDIAAALKLADDLVFVQTGKRLDYVQEAILRGTLKKRTYTQIAKEVYSSSSHVRNVGSELWKILSEGLGENITKASLKPILEKGTFYNYQSAIVENITGETVTVNNKLNICSKKSREAQLSRRESPAGLNGDSSPDTAEKNQNNAWIAIRIADNGPGISPEIQRRIFDTFFTTKPAGKGTGLGLAITHQIVTEKHKGKLNLHSTPGTGTEFEILLPLI